MVFGTLNDFSLDQPVVSIEEITTAFAADDRPLEDFDPMSPAEALVTGKPTLYFFTPAELCQIRYCRQAEMLGRDLQAHYQDRINFVPVTVHAIADYDGPEPYPQLMYENWDIWPTLPYSTWLPKPAMTEVGLGLGLTFMQDIGLPSEATLEDLLELNSDFFSYQDPETSETTVFGVPALQVKTISEPGPEIVLMGFLNDMEVG